MKKIEKNESEKAFKYMIELTEELRTKRMIKDLDKGFKAEKVFENSLDKYKEMFFSV